MTPAEDVPPLPPLDPAQEALVRARFMAIQLVRLSGWLMMLLGVAIFAGKLALPQWLGIVIGVLGFAHALFLPMVMIRKWRTPRP